MSYKKIIIFTLVNFLFCSLSFAENKNKLSYENSQTLDHTTNHVTIYANQAEIKRLAKVQLKQGLHWYRIGNLNSNLLKNTVRVSIENAKSAKMAQVLIESTYQPKELPPELAKDVKSLNDLYTELLDLQKTSKRSKQHLNFLRDINFDQPINTNHKFKEFKVFDANISSVGKAIDSVTREIEKKERKIVGVQREISKVQEKISFVQKKLKPYSSLSDQAWMNHVYVLIDSPKAMANNVAVYYKTPRATWKPKYDVRVSLKRNQGQAEIKLVTSGLIEQHTGENWTDVNLTLSSLEPVPLFLPKLNRWVFSERRYEAEGGAEPELSQAYANSVRKEKPMMKPSSSKGNYIGKGGRLKRPQKMKSKKRKESIAGSFGGSSGLGHMPSSPAMEDVYEEEILSEPDALNDHYDAPNLRNSSSLFTIQPLENIYPLLTQYKNLVKPKAQNEITRNVYQPNRNPSQTFANTLNNTSSELKGRLVEFDSPFKVSLKNDEPPLQIPLNSQKLKANLTYLAIPKLDKNVYLKAKTENTTSAPLMSGQAQVFMNGDLVSKTNLHTVGEGSFFDIDLGIDPNLKTKRKVEKLSEQSGLIRKEHSTNVSVTLEIKNNHNFPVNLILKDNYPLTKSDQVSVKLKQTTPSADISEKGLIQWNTKVPASTVKKFTFTYNVTHPENILVSEFN